MDKDFSGEAQWSSDGLDVLFVCSNSNHAKIFLQIAPVLREYGLSIGFLSLDSYYRQGSSPVLQDSAVFFVELQSPRIDFDWFSESSKNRFNFGRFAQSRIKNLLDASSPSVVVLGNDIGMIEQLFIGCSSDFGIKTILFQEGIWNIGDMPRSTTNLVLGDGGCDAICVWGPLTAESLRGRGYAGRIFVTGNPRFEEGLKNLSEIRGKNLNNTVLITGQCFSKYGLVTKDQEFQFYTKLFDDVLSFESFRVVFRPHPQQDVASYAEIVKERFLVDTSPDPFESILRSDVVLTVTSTTGTEALLLGKPVGFLSYFLGPIDYYRGIKISIGSRDELMALMAENEFPKNLLMTDREGGDLVRSIHREIDGKSSKIAADSIRDLAFSSRESNKCFFISIVIISFGSNSDIVSALNNIGKQEIHPREVFIFEKSGSLDIDLKSHDWDFDVHLIAREFHADGEEFSWIEENSSVEYFLVIVSGVLLMPGMLENSLKAVKSGNIFSFRPVSSDILGNKTLVLSKDSGLGFAFLAKRSFLGFISAEYNNDLGSYVLYCKLKHESIVNPLIWLRFVSNIRPLISILLCSYNRETKVRKFFESLLGQTIERQDFEVICVNDGSYDATGEIMKEYLKVFRGKYIEHPKNLGLSAARNSALREAKGKLVLFINDDTYLEPHALDQHVLSHCERGFGSFAVLGDIPFHKDIENRAISKAFTDHNLLFPVRGYSESIFYGFDHFVTGNLSVPLDLIRELDEGFDESFKKYGCEDIEFGYRLWRIGLRVTLNLGAKVSHDHLMTVDDYISRELSNNANLVQFVAKHPELVSQYLGVGRMTELVLLEWAEYIDSQRDVVADAVSYVRSVQEIDVSAVDPKFSLDLVANIGENLAIIRDYYKKLAIIGAFGDFLDIREKIVVSDFGIPNARSFNFVVRAVGDDRRLMDVVRVYAQSFDLEDDVCLHVVEDVQIDHVHGLIEKVLIDMGLSSDLVPDISVVDGLDGVVFLPILRSCNVYIPLHGFCETARSLGIPQLLDCSIDSLVRAVSFFGSLKESDFHSAFPDYPVESRFLSYSLNGYQVQVATFLRNVKKSEGILIVPAEAGKESDVMNEISDILRKMDLHDDIVPDIEIFPMDYVYDVGLFSVAGWFIPGNDDRFNAMASAFGVKMLER